MEIEVVKVDLPPLPDPPRLVFERPGKTGGRPRLRVTEDLVAALVAVLERTGSYGCAAEWCGVSEDWVTKLVAAEPLDLPDVHGVARKLVRARAKRRIQLVETLNASTCKIQSANAQFLLARLAPEFAPPKAPPTPQVPPQPVRVEFVAAPAPPAPTVAPTAPAPAAAVPAAAPAPPPKPTRPPTTAVSPAVVPSRPALAAPKQAAPAPARPSPVVAPRPAVPPAKSVPAAKSAPPRPGAPR